MDFHAETEKAKQGHFAAIGKMAYRRQAITVQIERLAQEADEIDGVIAQHEAAVQELERVQRNFNTYLAVKEGALTTDQVASAIQAGGNGQEPEGIRSNDNPAVVQPAQLVSDSEGRPLVLAGRKFNAHSCGDGTEAPREQEEN